MLRQKLLLVQPQMMNNHPTLLLEQSVGREETRYRQVLVLLRFHVKHGKRLSRRRQRYVARPYRGVAVLVDVGFKRR